MDTRLSWWCGHSYFLDHLSNYISELPDNKKQEKIYFSYRFNRMIKRLEESSKRSSLWYYSLSSLVTIGSIVVPPLISVQDKMHDNEDYRTGIYWSVWSISLSVTLSNAFIKLMSLDRTYITRNIRLNQFKSEAMKYITNTGKYKTMEESNKFTTFVRVIETFRQQQIYEEYTNQNNDNHKEESEALQQVSVSAV